MAAMSDEVAPAPPPVHSARPTALELVGRYVPIVRWLPAYDRADLRVDAVAGVVSWGVMVPVAMAYAGLAGVPPELGLVTAFTALTAYAIFGTSRHLKVTASSSIAIMSASVVGAIAASQVAGNYVVLSAGLALAVGAILVVAGAMRLGFLSQFLAASVVTGFVIGLAFVITVGQIPALLGIPSVSGTIIEKLVEIAQQLDEVDVDTAVLGIGTLVAIIVLKRIAPKIPGALVALIVGIVLSTVLDLPAKGVAVVGDVATGLPQPSIPKIPIGDIIFLITGAFGIVFLALAESIGAARSFGARHGYDIDPDQELIALGASNVAAGLFGGFAVDASFSQSATGEAAGNRTQLSTLITAALILATSIVLAPLFRNLPLSVLAAIVIASVLNLVDIAELRRYYAWRRTDFLLAMTALGGVVFTDGADRHGDRRRPVAAGDPVPGQPAVHRGAGPDPERSTGLRGCRAPPIGSGHRGLPDPSPERPTDVRQRGCREGPGHGPYLVPGGATACARPRHRRDGRLRRRDHGHAGRLVAGTRSARDRPAAQPGSWLGPRPDAPIRPDGGHRRGPLLPVRRGCGRCAPARPAERVSRRDAVLRVAR